ncbi:N-acetylmuramoyl-L-alanine amidase [Priestia endophytica]
MNKLTISSGHSLRCRGASGFLDEVNEARRVVDQVTKYLRQLGVTVNVFHDNASTNQNTNLKTIVAHHNGTVRDMDISVHFNASGGKGTGSEVFYYDKKELAAGLSKAIADALGIKDRGAKNGKGLYFVKSTKKPALLLEICFVDNKTDEVAYNQNFDKMCRAIAEFLSCRKLSNPIIDEPIAESKPRPTTPSKEVVKDNKKYRLMTGAFPNAEALAKGIERLKNDYNWLTYEKADSTELNPTFRIVTGVFEGKETAQKFADELNKKFGWLIYVKPE